MDYHKFSAYKKMVTRQKWATNSNNQTYLELLLTFTTIVFFMFFALRPTLVTISELSRRKEDLESIRVKFDDKIEALAAAEDAYRRAEPKLMLIEQALPKDENVTTTFGQIEIIAGETGAAIEQISFDSYALNDVTNAKIKTKLRNNSRKNDKNAKQEWLDLGFRVSAKGGFGNLRDFVIQLGKLRRVILIDSVSISKPSTNQRDESQELNLVLEGKIVYYP